MRLSVCLSVAYIGPKSRTERPRKTKIGTEIARITRDFDTTFKVKGQLAGAGDILWRPPSQLVKIWHAASSGKVMQMFVILSTSFKTVTMLPCDICKSHFSSLHWYVSIRNVSKCRVVSKAWSQFHFRYKRKDLHHCSPMNMQNDGMYVSIMARKSQPSSVHMPYIQPLCDGVGGCLQIWLHSAGFRVTW